MSVNEAKSNLQAQLNSQALADQVTVSRKDVERVLKCIDDVQAWARNFPQPSEGHRMNATDLEWDTYEGVVTGTDADGYELVEISALQDRYKCAKWGEKYTPGREWCVSDRNGDVIARGQSRDLRAAKKDATECLVRASA